MCTHVLVPLDGSERAERAAPVAMPIARATGAWITLLQALPAPFPAGTLYDDPMMTAPQIAAQRTAVEGYLVSERQGD